MKTFFSRRLPLAAIVLGAVLALALASAFVWRVSTPAAGPSPSPSPDTVHTAGPRTQEKPDRPANLVRVDTQGAAAAARYAFALSLWGLESGDHSTLDALCSGTENAWCTEAIQRIADVAARRATFTGCAGSTQVVTTTPVKAITAGEPSFGVELEFSQDDCTRKIGSDLTFWPAGPAGPVDLEVSHSGEGWHVEDVWIPK
jgi:hypothetical protein